MKVTILKRIEALEQKARHSAEPPTLIMIHFDDNSEKWNVTEHYASGNWKDQNGYKTKTSYFDRLQEFFFPAEFKGRVILDTFSNPDPEIYENFFCFDVDDLREGQPGEIAIQSITGPQDERSITVTINTYTK